MCVVLLSPSALYSDPFVEMLQASGKNEV